MKEFPDLQTANVTSLVLDQIEPVCWALLREGVQHASSPFRFPVLSTATADGVDARVLVLRSVDEQLGTLEFHTDVRSSKVKQLRRNPNVAWVFYDPARKVQLRVRSTGECLGSGKSVEAAWSELSEHAKRAYAQELTPGTKVEHIRQGAPCAHVENAEEGRKNFAVVVCEVREIEWLALSRAGHRCAVVQSTPEGWSSTWVMP